MIPDPMLIERFASTWMSLVMTMFAFATVSGIAAIVLTRVLPLCRTGRIREIVLFAGILPFLIPPAALQFATRHASSTSYRFIHADGMPPAAFAFVALHLVGILASLSWMILQQFRVASVTRASIPVRSGWLAREFARATRSVGAPSSTALRISHRIRVPCTTGVFSPVVLLPSRLPGSATRIEMRAVLVHELEHVRRRDVLVESFLRTISALWWFHPVPRLLAKRLRLVREELCDDAVVHGDERFVGPYAEALYRVAQLSSVETRRLGVVGMAGGEVETLAHRIRRLAQPRMRDGGFLRRAAAVAVVSGLMIGAASVTPSLEVDPRGDLRSSSRQQPAATHQHVHLHDHAH